MAKKLKFAIIGGGGYLGYHIAKGVVGEGHTVVLLDIAKPDSEWGPLTTEFKQVDILNLDQLRDGVQGADVVVHTVSYGMSGPEQLNLDRIELVNIQGTSNVIRVCSEMSVRALVYTSTVNVVYGGQRIHGGTEDMPYFPLHRHVDHYSRTKCIAEQLVLVADGKAPATFPPLRTCALRLQGIMGVGEKRHLPRIVENFKFLKFTYGHPEAKVQMTSIWNAVQGHLKASLKLVQEPDSVGGQAYFITDSEPINMFEYMRPLIEGLGYTFPRVNCPLWLMFVFSFMSIHWPLKLVMPLLMPAEIYKSGGYHTFSIEKARRLLGYKPTNCNDTTEVVQYYQEKMKQEAVKLRKEKSSGCRISILFIISGVVVALIGIVCYSHWI